MRERWAQGRGGGDTIRHFSDPAQGGCGFVGVWLGGYEFVGAVMSGVCPS